MTKRLLVLFTLAVLGTAASASAQTFRAGIMVGPSWPVGEAGSGLDTGFGGEGWVAVDLPRVPVMPRVAYAMDWFSSAGTEGDIRTRGGRLDLLVNLPRLLPGAYGFVGGGIQEATHRSFTDGTPPLGSYDPEFALSAGIGTRLRLGRLAGTVEGRYLTVSAAEFQVVQLRLGIGF
jgi:hypothetical protein